MRCPNCSNEVPDTANVCGYCGQKLKVATPPPQSEVRQVQPSSGGIPGWVWGVGGFVLIGGIVLVAGIVLMSSFGLFAPVSNNPSNQPAETPEPTQPNSQETGWVTVLEENFNDPSSIDVPSWKGKIVSNELRDSYDEQNGWSSLTIIDAATKIENGFRITFNARIIEALDEYSGWSLVIYTSKDSEFEEFDSTGFYFWVNGATLTEVFSIPSGNRQTLFEETKFPGFKGAGTSNVIQIEWLNSKISVWGNGQKLYEFESPAEGFYYQLTWQIHSRTEVGFDNLKLEEYHP